MIENSAARARHTHTAARTGYPSIDKSWLKYYSEKAINAPLPECTMYTHIKQCNADNMERIALNYYGRSYSYKSMFQSIDDIASALEKLGVKQGDPEHEQGELPVAFVEIAPKDFGKQEELAKELHRMCEEKVTYYSVPVDYVFVDGYPETSRGKIDYRELSRRYDAMAAPRQMIPQKQLIV